MRVLQQTALLKHFPAVTQCSQAVVSDAQSFTVLDRLSSCMSAGTSHTSYSTQSTPAKWDWAWVMGAKKGRKPAIKRPKPHQWYFCNPDYDPSQPLPKNYKYVNPYAPPTAWEEDLGKLKAKFRPADKESQKKYDKKFQRFLQLRLVDWREAFRHAVAEDVSAIKKKERLANEANRQQAWQEWKRQQFDKVLTLESAQSTDSQDSRHAP